MAVDLLSLAEVLERTGLSQSTFYRVRARGGEFPEPVRLAANKRLVVWRSDDVEQWCNWKLPKKPRRHYDP